MRPVLVDTSVWVEHFRSSNAELETLLSLDLVHVHPLIVGELACGTPPDRAQTLAGLGRLHGVDQATMPEVLSLIEREELFGRGCGLIDLSLLASTLLTPGIALWTHDRRLHGLAQRFGVAYQLRHH